MSADEAKINMRNIYCNLFFISYTLLFRASSIFTGKLGRKYKVLTSFVSPPPYSLLSCIGICTALLHLLNQY